jgi:hypothetical protein
MQEKDFSKSGESLAHWQMALSFGVEAGGRF